MSGSRDILLQEILRMELDKTGWRTVRAGEPLRFRHSPVHDQGNIGGRRKDAAKHGSCAHFHAGEFPEFIGRSKGNAGNSQRSAEITGHEGLVVSCDIEVEGRLLPVAQEHGLDNADANLGVDMLAVFHGKTGVRIHPFKGNGQVLEGRIYFLLQGR